jgi:hypothetical protein
LNVGVETEFFECNETLGPFFLKINANTDIQQRWQSNITRVSDNPIIESGASESGIIDAPSINAKKNILSSVISPIAIHAKPFKSFVLTPTKIAAISKDDYNTSLKIVTIKVKYNLENLHQKRPVSTICFTNRLK